MVAYLNKSDASEGFNQIIDFLNGSYIAYALTVNPTIYVSCIKQFWNNVAVKQSNDVTRLQALVDKKKVVVNEATIRDALHLDDAEGVDCLPNEEIFTALARMGYENPSTKLTFYKAFFSSQWKFLIHTILQSMSAKRTSWNEFRSEMASAVICLSTGHKFNFSKYIFESLVRNVDSSLNFYIYPRFIHLIIQNQLGDLSTHSTKYIFCALTQKVFANIRRVGKGCSGVETPLFEGMLVVREPEEQGDAEEQGNDDNVAEEPVIDVDNVKDQSIKSPTPPLQQPPDIPSTSQAQSPLPQQQSLTLAQPQGADFPMSLLQEALDAYVVLARRVEHLEHDKRVDTSDDTLMEDVSNQGRIIDELDRDEGAVEIVSAAAVVSAVVLETVSIAAVTETVSAAAVVPSASPVKVVVPSTKRRRGVVIRDPKEESSAKTPTETKSKDKGKGIMVEEPNPIKKKEQVELDEAYPRKQQEELNQDIDWEVAMDHVKQKAKETPYVQRYQVMKKIPQIEAQARRNMMVYLKNTVRFRLDYFKGMSYDDIRPIFEAKFNENMELLLKSKEPMEEEENRAIAIINETPAQKAAKRRRLNEETEDVEELKQHLEIVPDEEDDVYTEVTPLARKVPVVYYQIIHVNNKPRYKIIKADETHQLYASFITMLKNFNRDDLETLWSIVKERFSTSKPNNFSDEYLLTTLKTMFGRYILSKFALEQMLNVVRLQVEEQSEMSLELIRFTRQELQEGQHN
uniref:Synaptobrevin, longin-like domain protein n=1 Tax=Tanacetum cinerariifolium TaxID=118510 RepID=A0A699GYS3_TANCI|nr:hypothetical protein [Tanacetum cinerariifolium]